ncbi:ubiquitin-like domain-containing protein [Alkaliphilus crotonatoxidans]
MYSKLSNLRFLDKKILIVALTLVCLLVGFSIMSVNKTIVIAHDGQEVEIKTFSNTVGNILKQQGIEVNEADKVIPQLHERVEDGTRIVIHRAFEIQLVVEGEEKNVKTAESTVEALLKSMDIVLNDHDRVEPALEAPLQRGDVVRVTRVEEEVVEEEQEIPYQTLVKYNEQLEHGITKVVQEGKNGEKEVISKITFEDGVEVAREVVDEVIHQEAVNEIIEKGTLNYLITSRGEVSRYKRVLTVEATAYDAGYASTGKNPGDPYYGITSTGTQVRPGVVAVDPKVIPLGSKLYIESLDGKVSYGYAVAEDTGGAIKGNKIDIYYESRSEALRFGRKKLRVYVLE